MAANKINFDIELAIKCLISDSAICVYRQMLRDHFEYRGLKIQCPYRGLLKAEYDKYERERFNDAIDHIYDGH